MSLLRTLRVAAELKLEDLGQELKRDPSLLSRYETGDRQPSKEVVDEYLRVCSPRVDWSEIRNSLKRAKREKVIA